MTPPAGERKISQFTQPNFSDSEDLDMVSCNLLEDKPEHVSDTNSLHDDTIAKFKAHGSAAKKDNQLPRTKTEKATRPESKKKGRVIPSRYMQAASKVKTSLLTKMEKIAELNSTKVSKSLETVTPAVRKIRKNVQSADAKNGTRARPHTPENQSVTSTGGKTSTPTMDGSAFTHEMDTDVSAIHADVSAILAGDTSRLCNNSRTRSRLNHDVMGHSVLSNVSICKQSSKPKQKLDMKSMELQLDLRYKYNLQWAFLDAKARKHVQEQEKLAMAQIYGVYEEVEKLRKLKAEKEQQLARLWHTNITDHLVEVQLQCLGPVVNSLPSLKKQYSALAFALDTTRHQIPTKGIYLPDNEDHFQAQLEAQLLESEHLLGEISAISRQEGPNIAAMGNAMVAMETSVESMEGELKRIKELLAATETLTMHECSLRVQDMQLFHNSCLA